MHRLKVVRPQHQNHERQGRMHFDYLSDPIEAVAARFVRIVPCGSSAIEAVFNHAVMIAVLVQLIFHVPGPAIIEGEPLAR